MKQLSGVAERLLTIDTRPDYSFILTLIINIRAISIAYQQCPYISKQRKTAHKCTEFLRTANNTLDVEVILTNSPGDIPDSHDIKRNIESKRAMCDSKRNAENPELYEKTHAHSCIYGALCVSLRSIPRKRVNWCRSDSKATKITVGHQRTQRLF